ncbi:hypothetical protein [Nocardia farcinica]|uniref:hypothetical protein n=1 Tax=Nocardia farcinica TaxID=37329 RepID=UPI00245396DC|nr:hypothetical protein [Nocardia farcinica]
MTEGEWGVVKAGCVNGGLFDPAQHKALPSSIQPRREFKLAPGDLLMSRASGSPELIGSTGVVPEIKDNLLLCDKIYRIHIDKRRSSAPFLAYALRSHRTRQHIKMGISGAEGMANNLPTSVVRDCLIPKAPIDVQNAQYKNFDRTRDRTSQARRHIDISIALLTERRQALITAAVTGQFDVSTASGRNTIQGV